MLSVNFLNLWTVIVTYLYRIRDAVYSSVIDGKNGDVRREPRDRRKREGFEAIKRGTQKVRWLMSTQGWENATNIDDDYKTDIRTYNRNGNE